MENPLHIKYTDTLRQGTHKLNVAIDYASDARTLAQEGKDNADAAALKARTAAGEADMAAVRANAEADGLEALKADVVAATENADSFIYVKEYDPERTYAKNNMATYDGSTYIALTENLGVLPTDPTRWGLVARRGVDGLGAVSSVNNKGPNEAGDITLTAAEVGAVSTQELETVNQQLDSLAVNVKKFGVVGDGITDDTENLQRAINYALENDLLLSLNGKFAVTGITLSENSYITGVAKFYPIIDNQPYVVRINGRISWTGNLYVDGKNKALNGIVVSSFINSHITEVRVESCKVWGFVFDNLGNNNSVQIDKFIGHHNGVRHPSEFSITSSQSNIKTINLQTPLNSHSFLREHDILFLIYNNEPYLVNKIINSSTLEVFHLPGEVSSIGSIDVIVGGALNIPAYSDNGVGSWGSVDIFGNKGIGINMSALYGHTFNKLVAQGNSIGLSCTDVSIGVDLQTPYFELNLVDIVIGTYIEGRMSNPTVDYSKVFNIVNKSVYGFNMNDRLNIVTHSKKSNMSDIVPVNNPTNLTLNPSMNYAFYYNENQRERTFTIKNDELYKNTLSTYIHLTVETAVGMNFTFNLANNNGEDINGSTNYVANVFGKAHFTIVCVNKTWRIVLNHEPMKRSEPPFIGLYTKGHIIYNTNPVPGGYLGWVCTASGDPGVWKGFGLIQQ